MRSTCLNAMVFVLLTAFGQLASAQTASVPMNDEFVPPREECVYTGVVKANLKNDSALEVVAPRYKPGGAYRVLMVTKGVPVNENAVLVSTKEIYTLQDDKGHVDNFDEAWIDRESLAKLRSLPCVVDSTKASQIDQKYLNETLGVHSRDASPRDAGDGH